MPKQHSIHTLIQQHTNTTVPNLAQKIAALRQLNELWRKYIDIKLAQHTQVANWRNNCLVIEIDSASWATHIRYLLPELLIKLKTEKELAELKYIEWYIQPISTSNKIKSREPQPLSAENCLLLKEAAEHITHEKLKKALVGLAKHSKDE